MSGKDDLPGQFLGGLKSLFGGKGQQPAQPGQPGQPSQPTQPGQPGQPGQPSKPTQSAHPAKRAPSGPLAAPPGQGGYGAYGGSPTIKKDVARITAPLASASTTQALPKKLTPEEKAEESKRRMALIVTYLKNPETLGDLKDSRFLYKVITDEREYLMEVIAEWQSQLRDLCESWTGDIEDDIFVSARDELAGQIEGLKQKQAQMFMMLKKLTGVKGKTGGTGFLVMPSKPNEEGKAEAPK